ncbi:MAG: hypothetical protein LUQ28_14015, partial [Methylococcaceae bacterium]|nr:hypothetical protein [Methylococcaceae bacterium]
MAKIIKTNKSDYAPGETATITTDGFTAGSTVEFNVQHVIDPGYDGIWGTPDDTLGDNTGAGHEPWYVTDGGAGDLDGVANGSIQTEWYVNPDDSLNETFLLTATGTGADGVTGTIDDEVATTSFTDAGKKEDANLDQWQNGTSNNLDPNQDNWVNGNLNGSQAHYNEGDYVPYRTTLSNLDSNTKYWYQFQWDTTVSSGKHALDFLGTFDASFNPLPAGEVYPNAISGGPAPGDNRTVGSSTISTLDIPDDPRVLAGQDGIIGTADDIAQGTGVMTLYSGTFDGYALKGPDGQY